MKKRYIFGALAVLGAVYLVRMGLKMMSDVDRYNDMLAMSDEGTLQEETPELLMQAIRQQAQTIEEFKNFARHAPKDAARYMKIESM